VAPGVRPAVVTVRIEAERLPSGDYVLTLGRAGQAGTTGLLDRWSFRVLQQ
jgi:hypothetical protein